MPRQLRLLLKELKKAGFLDRGGKGSHRNFIHPKAVRVTLSGGEGDEAKRYQERDVQRAIEESKKP